MAYLDDNGLLYFWQKLKVLLGGKQDKITASGVLQGDGSGGVTAKTVDSAPTDGSSNLVDSNGVYDMVMGRTKIYTAACSTAAATAAKVATLDDSTGFSLTAGVVVAVRFTYGNSATTPTLRVDGSTTGTAKTIAIPSSTTAYTTGNGTTYNTWGARETILFTYTGTYWVHLPSGYLGYLAYNLANGKQAAINASGLLKGNGSGTVSAAVAGTDYQAPLTAGTDYIAPSEKGAASGIATLDANSKITPAQATARQITISSDTTLSATHNGARILAVGTITITVPSSLAAEYEVEIVNYGTGTVTIAAASGVSLNGTAADSKALANKYDVVVLSAFTATDWCIKGDV